MAKRHTILIVEDEAPLQRLYQITLEEHGYKTIDTGEGKVAARLAAAVKPDIILLDLGLPDIDGKEVIKTIRSWSQVPIIVCSVRNNDSEIIEALDLGADDYITKPFNPNVLLARIQTSLRRSVTQIAGEPELVNGAIRIDIMRHEVFLNNVKVNFTPKEYDLLRYFSINRGKMLTHKQILKDIWGPAHVENTQYLRVYVGQIRDKIKEILGDDQTYIFTEPGVGYRMEIVDLSQGKQEQQSEQEPEKERMAG